MFHLRGLRTLVLAAPLVVACVGDSPNTQPDAGVDAMTDSGIDVNTVDAAQDAPTCSKVCAQGDTCIANHCGRDVREVAAGGHSRYALLYNGEVWAWGLNFAAQIGTLPSVSDAPCGPGNAWRCTFAPTKVANLPAVTHVAAGDHFACAIAMDASVWCWGSNGSAQLGHTAASSPTCSFPSGDGGTTSEGPCDTAHMVAGVPDPVKQLAAGENAACALTTKGDLFCWGDNAEGQLGSGAAGGTSASPVPVVSFNHDVVSINLSISSDTHFTTCAARADGSAWCWGNDEAGQFSHATSLDPLADIAVCGHPCSATPVHIVKDANGNPFGQVVDVQVNQGGVVALHGDGSVWGWGNTQYAALGLGFVVGPTQVAGIGKATSISTRFTSGEIVDTAGRLWGFGISTGNLGIGVADGAGDASNPIEAASFASLSSAQQGVTGGIGLDSTGKIWVWGANALGELGHAPGGADLSCGSSGGLCALSPIVLTLP